MRGLPEPVSSDTEYIWSKLGAIYIRSKLGAICPPLWERLVHICSEIWDAVPVWWGVQKIYLSSRAHTGGRFPARPLSLSFFRSFFVLAAPAIIYREFLLITQLSDGQCREICVLFCQNEGHCDARGARDCQIGTACRSSGEGQCD